MTATVQLLGIRHHGPGSARSVVRALDALDPTVVLPGSPVTEAMVVLMLRPLLVDLLMATGLDHDEARGRLARV